MGDWVLGVIGGSGLYEIPGLTGARWSRIDTPWGEPSDELLTGELDGLKPKAVVLMIGTNNTGFEADKVTPRNTPAEAAEGVKAIVRGLRAKFPATKILLLAVFPRGEKPDNPQRLQVAAINAVIAKLDNGRSVRYLDIGPKFLAADGTLPKDVMPDFLHPNEKGYEIWAAAIKEPLAELLK